MKQKVFLFFIFCFLAVFSGCAKKVPLKTVKELRRKFITLEIQYGALGDLYQAQKKKIKKLEKRQRDIKLNLDYSYYYSKEHQKIIHRLAVQARKTQKDIDRLQARNALLELHQAQLEKYINDLKKKPQQRR